MQEVVDKQLQNQSKNQQNQSRVSVTNIQRKHEKIFRINADDYSTKHIVIFWVFYLFIIILVSLLTLALPKTFQSRTNKDSLFRSSLINCTNPVGFDKNNLVQCKPLSINNSVVGLLLRDLSPRNQFMFVYMTFQLYNKSQSFLELQQDVQVQYYQVAPQIGENGMAFRKIKQIQNEDAKYALNSYESQRVYGNDGFSFKGFRKMFGYQKYIKQQNSLIHFQFKNWPLPGIKNITIDATVINDEFTIFAILIRYIFFGISLGTSIVYYLRFRLIPQNMRTLQQKMVLYLSIFTVMFNDPLYAATIMAPNGFTAFTSVAFIVNFLTFLVAFWMIFIDRIMYVSGEKFDNVINKKKIAYFVLLYVSLFILEFLIALLRFNDKPMITNHEFSKGPILVFEIISFVLFAFGMAYICVNFARSAINFFDIIWRNQMFLMFSFMYIILIIVMLVINGFSVYDYTGNRILIFITFMNMYTIYLQYMYSVTSQQAKQLEKDQMLGQSQGNQVSTLVSNFGNEQIMVDLDSEDGQENYFKGQSQLRVNKYDKDRLQSKQSENEFDQQQTMDNLNQPKKQKASNFDTFKMQD